jgi:hypothetical protein
MIRRTFRAGLLLGLAAGAAGAIKRAVDSRRQQPATTRGEASWPPMADAEPVTVPDPPAPEQSEVVPAAGPDTEVHEGEQAEEHFADTERQPDVPTPDWNPADLQEGPATSPPAAPAKKAPAKKTPAKKATPAPWVEPAADGTCPGSHPVKAKLSSKIFHLPGGFNYPRTRPDRCYIDAAAAEADGLRPAKR